MRCTAASVRTCVIALFASVAGCGLFTGNDEKSISLSLDDDVVTVPQGSRDSVVVTLGRTRFDGPVTLSVEGTLPDGVSVTYSPKIIPAGSTSSRVRFIATGSVNPGTFNVTLRATGDGVAEKAVEIEVTVTLTGTFTLGTLGPVNVAQGGGGDATILLARSNGNASNVNLSVSGLPAGLAAVVPSPTTERAVTLRLTATTGVATGTYPLTITGAAAGFNTPPTTQLTVTVIAPPPTVAVSLPFCSGSLPVWFAYQNEGFGWQRLGPTGSAFNFAATQKVAIAYVLQFGSDIQTTLFFATRNELLGLTDRDCDGVKTLTGTVAGLTAGQTALVVMGANATTTTTGNFTLQGVAPRPLDIVATRGTLSSGDGFLTPDKLIVRRSQDLTTTIPTLDFTSAEAFSPATSNLTVSGFASGNVIEFTNNLWTTTSTYGTVSSGAVPGGVATLASVPGAQLVAGDKHELFVDSYQTNGLVGHSTVAYFTTTGDRTETLGPLLSQPSVSLAAASPYARLRGLLPAQPEYGTAARFVFLQGTSARKFLVLVATAGYFGGVPTTWDILTPDLTGAAAFDNSWMPVSGQSTPFSAEAFAGRDDVLFGAIPSAGETIKLAYRVSTTLASLRAPATEARARRAPLLTQYLRR